MKKNYDYDKIEKRIKEGFEGVERDIRFRNIEEVSVKKEKEKKAPGPVLQIIGAVLAAAIVGGGTFGALKYAEYRGSRIEPGSDPGIDSVYTEDGSVTSFYEDVQPAEPAGNYTFRGVTVIDTDKVTEDELKTALPLDHYYGSVRGVISEAAEKAGYEVFTYKLAAGEGVCVTKDGVGVLVFDRASTALSRVPSRLIIADETPSGHGMIFFTQYTDFSGRYGGMTSVFAYDTVTGETAPVDVFLSDDDPVSVGIKSSPDAVGYYGDAVIGYDENTGFINYQETFDPIYVESSDRAGEALLSNPYRLGYIDGKYVIGMPVEDQPADSGSVEYDPAGKNSEEYVRVTSGDEAYYPFICPENVMNVIDYVAPVFDYRGKLDIINNVKDRDWTVLNTSIFFPGIQSFDSTFAGMDLKQICSWIDSHETEMFRVTFTVTWDDPGDGNAKIYYVEFCVKKGAETTADPGTEFKGEYGLAIECDNVAGCPPVYASRVYKGGELISQKTDEAKAFICQITRDEGLNDLLPLHSVIRTPWAVISVEVGDKMFESVALAEEWIKDRIRFSSSTVNGFEITVTVTWDTVLNSDNTAVLPADDRTEYSYRFTAEYRMVHDTVPADERVLIEYADGKLRFTRIAAEPEFTVEKNGDMKASELDIHKLFAMLDGHDALDDPWDLVPSVTLRMMLDDETIYAFEMSHDGAVNVMRYRGSDREFIASMKLTADEIKTLSGESGHDVTETTAPAPEDPAYAEQTDAVMKELKTWLTGKLYDGMDMTDLLRGVGSVKGDGVTLKARINAGADLEVHNEEDGVFVRAGDKAYDFSVFALHDDRSTVFETRLFVYPGAEGFDMPFGLTPEMTPAEALEAMGYGTDAHTIRVNDGNTSFCLNHSGDTLVMSLSVIGEETAVSLYYELGGGSNVNIEFGHIESAI